MIIIIINLYYLKIKLPPLT